MLENSVLQNGSTFSFIFFHFLCGFVFYVPCKNVQFLLCTSHQVLIKGPALSDGFIEWTYCWNVGTHKCSNREIKSRNSSIMWHWGQEGNNFISQAAVGLIWTLSPRHVIVIQDEEVLRTSDFIEVYVLRITDTQIPRVDAFDNILNQASVCQV